MPSKKPSTPDIKPALSIRQVSELYRVPLGTLKCWRHRNEGPESFLRGGRVFYEQDVLAAYFAQEKANSTRGKVAS